MCTPTLSGYAFKEWNTSIDGNVTVYAIWLPIYTITFDSNGGSACPSQTQVSGNAWGSLCVPTLSGYGFDVWLDPNNNIITSSSIATGDISVTAQWKPLPTVTTSSSSLTITPSIVASCSSPTCSSKAGTANFMIQIMQL